MSAQWWLIPRARAEHSTPSRLVARVQFCQQMGVLRRAGARVKTGSFDGIPREGSRLGESDKGDDVCVSRARAFDSQLPERLIACSCSTLCSSAS